MSRSVIIACVVLAAVLLILAFVGPAACNRILSQKKQIEVSQGQAGAAVDAGAEAMNTVSNVQQANQATDQTVKEATDEIRKAPPGHSNDAAIRAACKLKEYRDNPRCIAVRADQ